VIASAKHAPDVLILRSSGADPLFSHRFVFVLQVRLFNDAAAVLPRNSNNAPAVSGTTSETIEQRTAKKKCPTNNISLMVLTKKETKYASANKITKTETEPCAAR